MRRVFGLCLAAVGLAGCGASVPRAPRPVSPVAEAQSTHEYPPPAPPRQRATAGSPSATAAVSAFADAYINWTAQTVSRDMAALASHSVGQARAAMELAAAQTRSDYELHRGGVANHGTVEAVARLRGAPDEYIVVTRELTTATATTAYQGLQPAWHLAIATVGREPGGGWVVSDWQPES